MRRIFTILLLASLCNPAWATKVLLPATQDNTLYESGSGLFSNGSGQHMFTGVPNEPVRRRAMIAFKNNHVGKTESPPFAGKFRCDHHQVAQADIQLG